MKAYRPDHVLQNLDHHITPEARERLSECYDGVMTELEAHLRLLDAVLLAHLLQSLVLIGCSALVRSLIFDCNALLCWQGDGEIADGSLPDKQARKLYGEILSERYMEVLDCPDAFEIRAPCAKCHKAGTH